MQPLRSMTVALALLIASGPLSPASRAQDADAPTKGAEDRLRELLDGDSKGTGPGDSAGPLTENANEAKREAALKAKLEAAAKDILWPSESDYPFDYVSGPKLDGPISQDAFFKSFGMTDGTPTQQTTLSDLFSMADEPDYYGDDPESRALVAQLRKLRDAIGDELTDVTVFRTLDEPSDRVSFDRHGEFLGLVTITIVGKSPDGRLVGLRTFSVET